MGALPDNEQDERKRTDIPRCELMLVTLIVGLYIVLGEIDRLISRVSSQGYSTSMAEASVPRSPIPLPTAQSHPWLTLHNLDEAAHGFASVFTLVDVCMALAYGYLLWTLLTKLIKSDAVSEQSPLRLLTKPRPWLARVAVISDLVEDGFLLAIVLSGPSGPMSAGLAIFAMFATLVKWVALLLAVTPMLYAVFCTDKGRRWAGRWGRALYKQRFSLVAVLPIAVLALVPGPGIFDQLPDVQRAWLDFSDDRGDTGLFHAGVAIVVLGLVACGLFLLGRLFTDEAERCSKMPGPREPSELWQWLFGPVVVGLGAIVLVVTGSGGSIRGEALIVFCAIPLFIAAFSWWKRRPTRKVEVYSEGRPIPVTEIWRVGDMLALASVVVACLGLVRSFTVLLMLLPDRIQQADHPALLVLQAAMPLLGLVAAVAVWRFGVGALEWVGKEIPLVSELIQPGTGAGITPVVAQLASQTTIQKPAPAAHTRLLPLGPVALGQRRPWRLAWAFIGISTVSLVVLALYPVSSGRVVGVLGALMVGLGSLMLLVGASAAVHAMWAPPEIFQTKALRLRATPVITLLTIAVLVASAGGSTPEIHGVRSHPGAPDSGTSYAEAVTAWKGRTEDCLVTALDGSRVRPMLFVAAEGGGIRAAYWTAAVLKLLHERTPCGIDSIVVASGVSGGAVGLEVARVMPVEDSAEAVWHLGDPNALSQASIGLLVRDPIFTVTGVPPLIDGQWLDRAGLMETAWETTVPGLAKDFYAPPAGEGLPAPLVLNSTDAASGCRVLVTHLEVGGDGDPTRACTDATAPLAYSRDIRSYMAGDDDFCLEGLRGSTAAMLAARFPYVTPSGVVGPCGKTPRAQLIDGGYAEGSGLGSLVDLAPKLLAEVPEALGEESADVTVQPIVVFLDNGRGGDLLPVPPQPRSELLIPPMGALTAGRTQNSTAAWLQRAQALSAGHQVLAPRVFVVAQGSAPTVEAPLGWVLSQASRDDMDDSIKDQLVDACRGKAIMEEEGDLESQSHPDLQVLFTLLGGCG
ncbi:hypothetical protein [Tessaracoccus sp.]